MIEDIKRLATQIESMSRDETEKRLLTLKYKELIVLCKILTISLFSNKKKDEIINRILYQIFDGREGLKLIKNFSC